MRRAIRQLGVLIRLSCKLDTNGVQGTAEAIRNAGLDKELEQLRQRNRDLVDAGSLLEQRVC